MWSTKYVSEMRCLRQRTGTQVSRLSSVLSPVVARPGRLRGSPWRRRTARRIPRTQRNLADFFFPDSQDQVDPSYDFERESSSPDRVRQRHDRYAHEVISPAPHTGMLLSKALSTAPAASTRSHSATGYTGLVFVASFG